MAKLAPEQRNYHYLLEAERTGIHSPILAALYQAHLAPALEDGETGLGVSATPIVPAEKLNTFPEQVQYGANTIRAFTDYLTGQGWQGSDLWHSQRGGYSDRFLEVLADGYIPSDQDKGAGHLLECDRAILIQSYLAELDQEYSSAQLPQNLSDLDGQLLTFIERLPEYYHALPHQKEAILEGARLWRKLDTIDQVLLSLAEEANLTLSRLEGETLDRALLQFTQNLSPNYSGLPYQREALLRLTQYWRELRSREETITSLAQNPSPALNLSYLDPALINFVDRIPQYYEGKGVQRNALTETFRLWRKLDSRQTALAELGINPALLTNSDGDRHTLQQVATQLDRELLNFVRRIPTSYRETEHQRESLIRLVQLWRELPTTTRAIESLTEDLKHLAQADRPKKEPKPIIIVPKRPDRWTPENIQIGAPIIPNGNFTWAEATRGGTRMPPNQDTVEAMVRIARLAQQARDRIGHPFIITSWYRPPHINSAVGGAKYSRHLIGDAIDFVCEDLSGNQLYWELDPWWPGGLGRYRRYPNLCHLDGRGYRSRWQY